MKTKSHKPTTKEEIRPNASPVCYAADGDLREEYREVLQPASQDKKKTK